MRGRERESKAVEGKEEERDWDGASSGSQNR